MDDKQIGEGMARPRSSSTIGKLTVDIKTRVDDDTRDELDRLAGDAGLNLSEFLRELIMVRVYGRDHVVRLHRARLAMVAGIGPEEGE
ncbi:ribbon-helix-helix protein, CopG family [Burkholderia sp. Bp9031]|uniref:ribbon-helix-helix protein, CopG family n=1 Tax=Burkholderia sp. Bp9031 TaxID=2184566 RepID=UPI000F5FF121|nr:ribbon-helix-helix protein, CopG family [Burkholderia sp. Bp9031]RQZ17255.1 ribbon-helix-helix protein, CopG family [Burkholderia sp. Bp9031]